MARPTLLNIETALCVERAASFGAAARKLNATQPAISLRVRELEASLNIKLFSRQGRRLVVTEEGRHFLSQVEPLIRELQACLGDQASTASTRVLRVGASQVAMPWARSAICTLQHEMSNLRFDVVVGTVIALVEQLERDRIDVAFVPSRVEHPKLHSVHVTSMKMLWVMAEDRWRRFGSYPGTAEPDLVDLLNRGPIWLSPKGSPYSQRQAEILQERGCNMKNINWCSDVAQQVELICTTGGFGSLPAPLTHQKLERKQLVLVERLDQTRELEFMAVTRRTDQHPALHRLIKLVQQASLEAHSTAAKQ